ncbi:MAG: tRNA (adenosine(37)-N6)-threonylcarbamoyltransferase complex dimerization subunit type 1 TsaB [Chloroflexota bacterium]|nr:tRNA (adenosine(37)-N6)-threonylcarbamoyltransferase complex dimerization subunit type 1 TsaB [Chloroflexota bacterium]
MSAVLAIDTASPAFALAFDEGPGEDPRVVESAADFTHASLLAAVEEHLRGAALAAVVAVCGPGSYSGLRAGIATAQGLALAQGCDLAGISTLEAVAAACEGDTDAPLLTAVHPAGRGELAVQDFRGLAHDGPMRIVAPDDLRAAALAGEGAGALGGREVLPRDRALAALARFRAGALEPVAELTAIYLRDPNITAPRRPFGSAGAQDRLPAR